MKDNLLPGGLNRLFNNSIVLDSNKIAWQKRNDEWVAYGKDPIDSFELWEKYRPIALAWQR
jgi:hypothetical protein